MHLLLLLQAALGRIEGTVTSDAGVPIPGATVTIATLDRNATTNTAGQFLLRDIGAGAWQVVVVARGFEPTTLRIDVPAGRSIRVDIGLTPATIPPELPVLEVIVRQAGGGAPLELATVELDGQARTAVDGRVVFRDVAPGLHRLRARRLGFTPRDTSIVAGRGTTRVVLALHPQARDLPPLSVTALRSQVASPIASPGDLSNLVTTGLTRLGQQELRAVPPTFERDVLRAVQATAGVGAANDVNAHLAIRGGAPEHTTFLLDGAPVLGPYHMFGLFGAFNPDAVDDAQILRGSLPARVGGALGSVVSLRSTRPRSSRLVGGVTVLTSRLAGSGPLGQAGSWLVAGRRTNLGFGKSGLVDLEVPYWFWDLQGTLRLVPGKDQEVTLSTYGSGDKFSEDLFFIGEGTAPLFSTWRNRVASATWRLAPANGWGASVGLWHTGYQSTLALGDTTLRADSASTTGNTRMAGVSVGIGRTLPSGTIRLGIDLTSNHARLRGDTVAPGYLDDRVDRRTTQASASVEFEHRVGAVTLSPGVRATRWSNGAEWSVEPRAAVRWNTADGLAVTASVTQTTQALFALRDDRLPILGVPFFSLPDSLEPRARATSFEVAVTGRNSAGWVLEASLFHRRLSGLPRWRPSGRRDLSQIAYDDGTATGLELSVERRTGRLTGWATYTPMVATIEQSDGTTYRPLWDRRHAVDLVAQLAVSGWAVLSYRLSAATGQPFWVEQGMFTGSEFDPVTGTARQRSDATFPIWSNTQATLPAYFRTDLTATASWQLGRLRVAPFAGLINLTGRRNVNGYRAQPGGLQGTIEYLPRRQLPRVPVLGIDVSIGGAPSR